MFKVSRFFVCVLFALLVITSGAFAVSEWVMEWYSLDPVEGTGTHAAGIAEDWLLQIFGREEATFSEPGRVPPPTLKGTRDGKELGWFIGNLVDTGDDRNLSNGIYGGVDGDKSNYVYYGMVAVISPSAQDTVMHVAQDDQLMVWINGELAATDTSWTGGATSTRPHDIHLDAGVNIFLVKVSEEGGGDYLNVQFDAEDLTFNAAVFDIAGMSVSPVGNLSTTWGGLKSSR